jgi:hypothetical protein
MAHKGPRGILEMHFAPPDDQGRMHLILACGLGGGFPRLDFPHHLPLELTGEATSFESQGVASFYALRKLHSLSPSRGAVRSVGRMF